LIIILI